MAEGNGHYKDFEKSLNNLADKQDSIEMVLIKGFDDLKNTMNHGHKEIAEEIRRVREIGSLPLPLVERLIDNVNVSNSKNVDKVYKILVIVLVALLGIKAFLPNILG